MRNTYVKHMARLSRACALVFFLGVPTTAVAQTDTFLTIGMVGSGSLTAPKEFFRGDLSIPVTLVPLVPSLLPDSWLSRIVIGNQVLFTGGSKTLVNPWGQLNFSKCPNCPSAVEPSVGFRYKINENVSEGFVGGNYRFKNPKIALVARGIVLKIGDATTFGILGIELGFSYRLGN